MIPDLIHLSGREELPVSERVALLRSESVLLRATVPARAGGAWSGADIHDVIGLLTSYIDILMTIHDRNPERLDAEDLSLAECRVLAWRRGGIRELRAIVRGQRRLA